MGCNFHILWLDPFSLLNALLLTLARNPLLGPFLPAFVDNRKHKRRDQLTGLPFDNPQPFNIPAILGSPEGTCLGSFTFTVPGVYDYNSSVSNQAALGSARRA